MSPRFRGVNVEVCPKENYNINNFKLKLLTTNETIGKFAPTADHSNKRATFAHRRIFGGIIQMNSSRHFHPASQRRADTVKIFAQVSRSSRFITNFSHVHFLMGLASEPPGSNGKLLLILGMSIRVSIRLPQSSCGTSWCLNRAELEAPPGRRLSMINTYSRQASQILSFPPFLHH